MSLKSIIDSYKVTVETPGGNIAIRGLSLADITSILTNDRAAAERAFEKFGGLADGQIEDTGFLAGEMLNALPKLAERVLALAIDDPDADELAGKIPTGLQIVLLEAIIRQTAAVEGGMGKVFEIVISALEGTKTAVNRASSLTV